MNGAHEEKKKTVRSSIACSRCRRSKVKCVNDGPGSKCKACEIGKRECEYPPGQSNSSKRPEATPGIKQENDGESKKKIRRIEDVIRRHGEKVSEDPLDSSILTRKVWAELSALFKLHFSTEMPFIHPVAFREKFYAAAFPRDTLASDAISHNDRVLLLGVLTLTARFHPRLVAYHDVSGNAARASEFYATALAATLGPLGGNMDDPLEDIQAFLMLALYEWGQTKGLTAWVYLGIAIRLAQSIGLEFEDDPEMHIHRSSSKRLSGKSHKELATEKEIRRRTLWSCFFMDRVLSAGKFRPSMMNSERLHVRLPHSETNFLFVDDVRTGFLQEIPSNNDGVLSWHVRLVAIFGHFSVWSYAGGRRTETLPPWDQNSQVVPLRTQLENFHESLPSKLAFNTANLSAYLEQGNATPYISMHMLYFLCLIMLHREYIPFIPLRCQGPEGPLDEPTFPKEKYDVPDGFWEISAEIIFKAAREIIDMACTCQESDALPGSPLVVFAVYQAAFVALYAVCFPHMDTRGHICSSDKGHTERVSHEKSFMKSALEILRGFRPKVRMATEYLNIMKDMKRRYDEVLDNWVKNGKTWPGGGLEQYKLLEKDLKEFGRLENSARNNPSEGSDIVDQSRSRASTNEYQVSGDIVQGVEPPVIGRTNVWASINGSGLSEIDERSTNQSRQLHGMASHQSPNQSSIAPSLVSTINGETTPSVKSPYSTTQQPQYHSSAQPQHTLAYSSHIQHPMPPPNAQDDRSFATDPKNDDLTALTGYTFCGTGMDNFAQVDQLSLYANGYPMETQPGGLFPYAQMYQPAYHYE